MKKSIHDQRYMELIAKLRSFRKKKLLSQAELAAKMGKPQSFIAKVESCERRVDLIETIELCIAIGISISDIIPNEFRNRFPNNANSKGKE